MTARLLFKKIIGSRKRIVISAILLVIFLDLCILSAPRRRAAENSSGSSSPAEGGHPDPESEKSPVHPRQRRHGWDTDFSAQQERERQRELDHELGRDSGPLQKGEEHQERLVAWQPQVALPRNTADDIKLNEVGVDEAPDKDVARGSDWTARVHAVEPNLPHQRLEIESGEERVNITLDGHPLLVQDTNNRSRGLHVVVLHQTTGAVMARRRFDTILSQVHQEAVRFLDAVRPGRIIVLATKDDISFQMHSELRFRLTQLGSQYIPQIGFRDQWAMVVVQGSGEALGETLSPAPEKDEFGGPLFLRVDLQLGAFPETPPCQWEESEETERRHSFCDSYEGYPGVCRCLQPHPILPEPSTLEENIDSIYVAVVATHRPYYLYRTLRSLAFAQGVQPSNVVVYLENDHNPELEALVALFSFKVRYVAPEVSTNIGLVIGNRFIDVMNDVFTTFMEAEYVLSIEEDLECSPDIFRYFGQTHRLLKEDPTIFSVSAFNLQSRTNTSMASDTAYRVDNFSSVAFLISRDVFEKDVKLAWSEYSRKGDWEFFINRHVLNGRENIWPDVNRVYHIGRDSHYINTEIFDTQYRNLSVNPDPSTRLKDVSRLHKIPYEEDLKTRLSEGMVLSNYTDMCSAVNFTFALQRQNVTEIIYFEMENISDLSTWSALAKCWGLWPYDTAGHHDGLWRFWLMNKKGFLYHFIFIGVPFSQYSSYKPTDVTPYRASEAEKPRAPLSAPIASAGAAPSSISSSPASQELKIQPQVQQAAPSSSSSSQPSPNSEEETLMVIAPAERERDSKDTR